MIKLDTLLSSVLHKKLLPNLVGRGLHFVRKEWITCLIMLNYVKSCEIMLNMRKSVKLLDVYQYIICNILIYYMAI